MSVHGEYARALGGVRERLEALGARAPQPHRSEWLAALDASVASPQRDLSKAARNALLALDAIEGALAASSTRAAPGSPETDESEPDWDVVALLDACRHLRAHCRAVLGVRNPEA